MRVRNLKTSWKLIQIIFLRSSPVMRAGATATTRKQSNSQVNRNIHPHHARKKARQVKSNVKTMLICFFDASGIVHMEFVPPGQTVNQTFYLQVLRRLRDAVRRKRPDLWQSGEWWFRHDNAPAHTALSVRQFWTKTGMTPLPHPPYSPDLAPCDFFCSPE